MRKAAVIGLGRFGMALAKDLAASGVQVIALDRDGRLVNEVKDFVDLAVRADGTDQAVLQSQEIDKVDVCVVAIGEQFEAALLATVIAKQFGIPEVICRAQTEFHAEIFRKIGADRVIQPEQQAGEHLARQLANPQLIDFIQLADQFTLLEFPAPKQFQGKTIAELALRNKFHVNLVVIRRLIPSSAEEGEEKKFRTVFPRPDEALQAEDVLVVVGSDEALSRLPRE
ncbi:Ktr system potassium uptake protein A [Thalassoglobus neptunius]|uniref:Ktr system potassium uptake protein A n=1 Tax=Thalassoglobus neptunius TaxID=1938619 RepID=A0A5C5X662_9PLAN|nr:TrkA family potassium uptake protein [Thalassoglobus neptunius]TWT57753.1 Ktr system potassium uptake protein A [Thalassoglobus neptunius]